MNANSVDHSSALRDLLNYYIDDEQIPSSPGDSITYLLKSRKFLAKFTCASFLFLKKHDLLEEFCTSFHP